MPFPEPPSRPADAKPIVVLDPGHGGVDPGTSQQERRDREGGRARNSPSELKAEARRHRALRGLHLTREDDTFLPLKERVAIAQKKGAGLFLSIHADYFPTKIDDARGATVYTLSEQASDEEARALAAKENFSDAIAGVELPSEFR